MLLGQKIEPDLWTLLGALNIRAHFGQRSRQLSISNGFRFYLNEHFKLTYFKNYKTTTKTTLTKFHSAGLATSRASNARQGDLNQNLFLENCQILFLVTRLQKKLSSQMLNSVNLTAIILLQITLAMGRVVDQECGG